jgi:hypothetical protein
VFDGKLLCLMGTYCVLWELTEFRGNLLCLWELTEFDGNLLGSVGTYCV